MLGLHVYRAPDFGKLPFRVSGLSVSGMHRAELALRG